MGSHPPEDTGLLCLTFNPITQYPAPQNAIVHKVLMALLGAASNKLLPDGLRPVDRHVQNANLGGAGPDNLYRKRYLFGQSDRKRAESAVSEGENPSNQPMV